ncbi:MAG: hypothetical protein N3A62_04850 [Thermodesulfovibrionales bacterium]|nr:hypothetical protein [Thermodesulfovibrionales bacterium]
MAVESVKNTTAQMAQEMLVRSMKQNQNQNVNQSNQMQTNNQQQSDRVTLNSRQTQDTNTNNQTEQKNPAMGVPGQSQKPTAQKTEANAQTNNANVVAQLIQEAMSKTNTQQTTNPYNPNKPNQTQNQINYTV